LSQTAEIPGRALSPYPFGALISATAPQPLAHGTSSHATALQIGNNSDLRATDTLLDFVFVRPAAQSEPRVVVERVH
jgi:hypothetical protein